MADHRSPADGQGTVPVEDGFLWYEIAGTGPSVVLLHAGLLDSRMWDGQFQLLKQRYRVLRYDARGHGRSSTPASEFAHYEDLAVLLDELDVSSPTLVGVSLGARTAVDFAIDRPERLAGLVLAGPGISGWEFSDPIIAARRRRMMRARRRGNTTEMIEQFVRMWVDGPHRSPHDVDPALRRRLTSIIADTISRHGHGSGDVREVGAADRLAEIRAPGLTMLGQLDSDDIQNISKSLADTGAAMDLVEVPGAGHMLNLEAEETFNACLLTFLRDRGG